MTSPLDRMADFDLTPEQRRVRQMVRECFEVATYAVERIRQTGRNVWRHKNSITVVFDRPSPDIPSSAGSAGEATGLPGHCAARRAPPPRGHGPERRSQCQGQLE